MLGVAYAECEKHAYLVHPEPPGSMCSSCSTALVQWDVMRDATATPFANHKRLHRAESRFVWANEPRAVVKCDRALLVLDASCHTPLR